MKSVANRLGHACIHLVLVAFLPGAASGAQAHSSMAISVEVVRGSGSTAAAALFEAAELRDPARSATSGEAECKTIGNVVVADGALAICSWDSESHAYLVTVQY